MCDSIQSSPKSRVWFWLTVAARSAQTVLLNVGRRDGIVDGWAAIDGIGLVGRIAGVGERTSRVILLTDTSSRIAVSIEIQRTTCDDRGR